MVGVKEDVVCPQCGGLATREVNIKGSLVWETLLCPSCNPSVFTLMVH